jgi:hypothetical protein
MSFYACRLTQISEKDTVNDENLSLESVGEISSS